MKNDLLARVRKAHAIAARLVLNNPVYVPIFEAFEADIKRLEAADDPISRARAAVQKATAETTS